MAKPAAHKHLEDDHHVIRLCSRQKQATDEQGKVIGVNPSFFELKKDRNESYLSCSWLEYFLGTDDEKLQKVHDYMKAKMKIGTNALLAKSNVLKVKNS